MKSTRVNRRNNNQKKFLHKLFGALSIVPFIAIILGTQIIINDLSPEYLFSTSGIIDGFLDNFSGHAFILIGSLILTLIVWDLTHDSWKNGF